MSGERKTLPTARAALAKRLDCSAKTLFDPYHDQGIDQYSAGPPVTDTKADVARIRGLIFESVSRSDVFEKLVGEVDELMRLPHTGTLSDLSADFADASAAAGQVSATGYGVPEIRFTLERSGRVQGGTASAIALFALVPGEDFADRLGENGQAALAELVAGKRAQAMFTLFADPQSRPVLVFAQGSDNDKIDAFAILLRWNNAIAPYLRDGFALTEAEIDVVEHLFRGSSPKEIARRRNRSLETVRTQLRTICRKTDTHGIGDLVHLIYGLIATLPHLQTKDEAQVQGRYMLNLPTGRVMDLETTGPVGGKPLLFLHGCLGGRRLPPTALAALDGYRIIAPGRPGHGQSRGIDGKQTDLADVVTDLIAMLDHLGIGQIDVLSYDLGAPFALWMAARVPDRITSLSCLAPVPPLVGWKELMSLPAEQRIFPMLSRINMSAARYLAQLGGQRLLRKGPQGFGQVVFAGASFDRRCVTEQAETQRLFWHGHAWHTERGPDGFLGDAQLAASDWTQDLPKIPVPTQFVVGEEDRNIPAKTLDALARQTGARISRVPNAGHSLLHAAAGAWIPHVSRQGRLHS